MRLTDARLLLSASDLVAFLECEHLSALDLRVAHGLELVAAPRTDVMELVARKGDEHERAYLEALVGRGVEVVALPSVHDGVIDQAEAVARTEEAMRGGADVIYQAALRHGGWRGFADFLERVPAPSPAFGEHSYEVLDTKLARHAKPRHIVQLCVYSDLLARVQGHRPEWMHVLLGSGERQSFRVDEFFALYRRLRRRYRARLAEEFTGTYPDPVEHCELCRWSVHCDARRADDDHLSLVAGLRRDQTARLSDAGITTVARLASVGPGERPESLAPETFEQLREQARLQVHERSTGEQIYELVAPAEDRGFARLPEPRPGDLFFDIEGDPFFAGEGLEYLLGVTRLEVGEPVYRAFWAHDRGEEKRAFEAFVDFVIAALAEEPSLHVYHYAPYESTALKRLAGRHRTREAEVDRLLGDGVLVDLYAVTRQAVRLSKPGYSLKQVEAFYMGARGEDVTDAGDSIVRFEQWVDRGEQSLLDAIEAYNEVDCVSTVKLHRWLLERRREAERRFATTIPWRWARTTRAVDPEASDDEDEDEPRLTEHMRLVNELSRLVERAESSP